MNKKCQIDSVNTMSTGKARLPPLSVEQSLRIFARRHINPETKRRIKVLILRVQKFRNPQTVVAKPVPVTPNADSTNVVAKTPLQGGDLVRVRDREVIEGTLNQWRQHKGCAFMGEMWQYCGTVQRVMKRVQRFVDERDAQVHKTSGIVLLENVICQGTADYGPCDRSCFYFWREEWLEKIEDGNDRIVGGGDGSANAN